VAAVEQLVKQKSNLGTLPDNRASANTAVGLFAGHNESGGLKNQVGGRAERQGSP